MKQAAGAGAPSMASPHLPARAAFGRTCSEPYWRWPIMPKGRRPYYCRICPEFHVLKLPKIR